MDKSFSSYASAAILTVCGVCENDDNNATLTIGDNYPGNEWTINVLTIKRHSCNSFKNQLMYRLVFRLIVCCAPISWYWSFPFVIFSWAISCSCYFFWIVQLLRYICLQSAALDGRSRKYYCSYEMCAPTRRRYGKWFAITSHGAVGWRLKISDSDALSLRQFQQCIVIISRCFVQDFKCLCDSRWHDKNMIVLVVKE